MVVRKAWQPDMFPKLKKMLGNSAIVSFYEFDDGFINLRIWIAPEEYSKDELETIQFMNKEAHRIIDVAQQDFIVGEVSIEVKANPKFVEGHINTDLQEKPEAERGDGSKAGT